MKNVYILLTLVSLIWGGSFVVVKSTTSSISPIDLSFLRFLIASPIMLFILFISNRPKKVHIKDTLWILILGLSGVTFLYIFQFTGIKYIEASTSSVLINTNVIFIAIFSAIFLKEELKIKKLVGILGAFIGVIIMSINSIVSFDNMELIGCTLIILSAVCWAIYSIVGKYLISRYDELTITTYAFLIGTFLFIPFLDISKISMILNRTALIWMDILYLSILCSVFGYIGWYYSLSKIDASKGSCISNYNPCICNSAFIFIFRRKSYISIYNRSNFNT